MYGFLNCQNSIGLKKMVLHIIINIKSNFHMSYDIHMLHNIKKKKNV